MCSKLEALSYIIQELEFFSQNHFLFLLNNFTFIGKFKISLQKIVIFSSIVYQLVQLKIVHLHSFKTCFFQGSLQDVIIKSELVEELFQAVAVFNVELLKIVTDCNEDIFEEVTESIRDTLDLQPVEVEEMVLVWFPEHCSCLELTPPAV